MGGGRGVWRQAVLAHGQPDTEAMATGQQEAEPYLETLLRRPEVAGRSPAEGQAPFASPPPKTAQGILQTYPMPTTSTFMSFAVSNRCRQDLRVAPNFILRRAEDLESSAARCRIILGRRNSGGCSVLVTWTAAEHRQCARHRT